MSVPILDSGVVQGQILRSDGEAGVWCHDVLYSAGSRLEPHGHRQAFFALTLDGSYRESACGQDFQCPPRSVVFHPPGEEHSICMDRSAVRCFIVEIDSQQICDRYDSIAPSSLLHAMGGAMSDLAARMYAEFRLADSSSSLAMQGLLLQILALASRGDSEGECGCPPWLRRIDSILRERFRSRLTLDEISREVGVAPTHLSLTFRRVHGRSLAEEQRRLRIEFACDRLQDRCAQLAEVAAECGFADQPHFTRAFKQLVGLTPAQYRALFA